MPTYIYETVSKDPAVVPERFEIEQRMSAAALTVHPESGVPIQRVITGGAGIICDRPGSTVAKPAHVHTGACRH